jgi:acetyl esterase/lipase
MLIRGLGLAAACALSPTSAPDSIPTPDLIVVTSNPLVLIDHYEQAFPSNCAGHSLDTGCHETLLGIYYPSGSGPSALGYANPARPVLIQLRGGNANAQTPIQFPWFQDHVLPHGFAGVDPNFAPVSPGEDYKVSLADVAYLVQYLRHCHEWLNIDPQRIFVFGRSFGGIMSLAVGLRDDAQDLASADPVRHQSSRPNCVIPFSALADLNCLGPNPQYGEYLSLWFPAASAAGAAAAQKDADSPKWWLTHLEAFGRAWTPRICLGHAPPSGLPCGLYDDPHEGGFGPAAARRDRRVGRAYR